MKNGCDSVFYHEAEIMTGDFNDAYPMMEDADEATDYTAKIKKRVELLLGW